MKKIVHVNQHVIRANINRAEGEHEPPITVRTYKGTTRGHTVEIEGKVSFVYRPHDPLSCGARLWAETHDRVIVDGEEVR